MSGSPRDVERAHHEQWLGMAQPIEGLVVAIPCLLEAQCLTRLPLTARDHLRAHCTGLETDPAGASAPDSPNSPRSPIVDLDGLLFDPALLAFRRDDFAGDLRGDLRGDAPPGDVSADDSGVPEDLSLWVAEGRQRIAPDLALRRKQPRTVADDAPRAVRAGADFDLLVWRVPDGLDLDRPEDVTGTWHYPPTAKLDRLLRHTRVPIGLLSNGAALRLIYAPHGESSGWLTFRIADLVSVGGRPLLDALVMLLGRASFRTRAPEHRLPALLADSRKRQDTVTEALAEQVFSALAVLLAGFEAAAERDGGDALEDARQQGDEHLYGGLLTVLLRLVFLLYAEDRGLVPVDDDLYAEHLSVLGLFDRLQRDAGEHPDAMDRRFGAWDRLIAVFRAVWLGVEHESEKGRLSMPPRRGTLFDPNTYPFLEGWPRGGSAPVTRGEARARVRVPSVDDGTVFEVLRNLVILEGQRLSYRTLDVEQIGSVYEALMGYRVERVYSTAVCLRANRFWLASDHLREVAANQRPAWLQREAGLARADARKIAAAFNGAAAAGAAAGSNEDVDGDGDGIDRDAAVVAAFEPFRRKDTAPVAPGRLVLQPGSERRRTSSHYTPRALSEPVVRRTLEPLIAALGDRPSSERLLSLEICDPAMGSGAFLVESCRFLADHVVAAWTREGQLEERATGHDDVTNHARRLVAQRCLYGVDKNRFAVELAKLSLWLATLARDLPFTFLDHALRWGDALVGLDFRQLKGFHWRPEAQQDLASRALEDALDEAIGLRQHIVALAGEGPEAQREKERLLRDVDDAVGHARLIGDIVVGAFFDPTSGDPTSGNTTRKINAKVREQALGERLTAINAWLEAGGGAPPAQLVAWQAQIRQRLPVFHWMLEFPEVFHAERPDPLDDGAVNHAAYFDAFVGNPPFLRGGGISENFGGAYRDWLLVLHEKAHGNSDLCAHFPRRADRLLGDHGVIGFIVTNTISQGDTRTTGLQYLVNNEMEILAADTDIPWPGGGAAVTVSLVHLARGTPAEATHSRRLNGRPSNVINSRLRPKEERPDPRPLTQNRGLSFLGSKVYGQGFVLSPEERDALISHDQRNDERIYPYLGGQEVNTSPTQDHHRYVISFGQMSLEEAAQWPDLLAIVREKVKPERDRLKNNADGRRRKAFWWQFGRETPALAGALAMVDRCLANSQVSKHLLFARQPTGRVFSHALFAYPLETDAAFAVLQSRIHEVWARLLSSSMKTDLRYTASDCFETFPFPQPDPRAEIPALEAIGKTLYDTRAQYLIDTDQGLTQCYNQLKDPSVHDPRVAELRALHLELDRAVIAAYGWPELDVPPFTTPQSDAEQRTRQAFEDDIIDRLFVLNNERAQEERRLGLAASAKGKGGKGQGKSKTKTKSTRGGHEGQGGLFG